MGDPGCFVLAEELPSFEVVVHPSGALGIWGLESINPKTFMKVKGFFASASPEGTFCLSLLSWPSLLCVNHFNPPFASPVCGHG